MLKGSTVFGMGLLAAVAIAGCDGDTRSAETAEDPTLAIPDSLAWFNDQVIAAPESPAVYLDRGKFFLRGEQSGAAISDYERALALDSTLVDDRHALGELRFGIQDFEGAVREWESVLDTDSEHVPSLLSLARVDLLLRSYDPALKRINDALRLDSRLDDAYFLKGRLYMETGDTIKAASSFQTVVEVAPERYDAYIQLGMLYAAAHDDLALEFFKTARNLKPNSIEAIYDEAMFLQEHGDAEGRRYADALALYDLILTLDATNASAAFNKGFVHLEYLSQYDSAAFWFGTAIDLLPYYHQAHFNKGLALESMGDPQGALDAYNTALSFAPAFTPAALAKGRVIESMR
jgi:tetratricopeptide (TPR) repeat protein